MAVASAGHVQVCTSLQTDNHTSTSPLSFLQAGCPSCRPTNSVKALKALNKAMYVCEKIITYTHTHTRLTALFSGTTQVSRYQKSDQVNKKTKNHFMQEIISFRDSMGTFNQFLLFAERCFLQYHLLFS